MKTVTLVMLGVLMTQKAVGCDYSVGQIWAYKTRVGEEASRVTIAKIDDEEVYGCIYHIYVDRLQIRNHHLATGVQTELHHAPVNEETLDKSVTKLVGIEKALPDISEGYTVWREPFEQGDAGVFNISVAEIINVIERVANQSQ